MKIFEPQKEGDPDKDTGRLEAFSDGVFAIAITLLVLDIKLPKAADLGQDRSLLDAVLDSWPIFLAYFTSFLTVLVMWVNHHNIFKIVRKADQAFLLLNGLLLMFVTLVPFPTALLAEYLNKRGEITAGIIYCGTYLLIALIFNLLWRYASYHNRLLVKDVNPSYVQAINRQYLFGPVLYLACVVVAFFSAIIAFLITLGLAIFFALPLNAFSLPQPENKPG